MKIELLVIGKTDTPYLREGISLYEERLKHYVSYSKREIPDIRNVSVLSKKQIKEREGELILKALKDGDYLILLDERGELGNSEEFASRIERLRVSGVKRVVFSVGGAYGFSDAVYSRSNDKFSLSKMTFSHQMVRVIFLEQLYRAFTILKGEPYHNR